MWCRAIVALLAALLLSSSASAPARRPPASAPYRGFTRVDGGWQSPAGVVYLRSLGGLLSHSVDKPHRRLHGVFFGSPFEVVDEAYRKVRAGGKGITTWWDNGRQVFEVDMGRPIGFLGGELGKHLGRPKINHVRLVLEGDVFVSAYPERPTSLRPVRAWSTSSTLASVAQRTYTPRPPPAEIVRPLEERGVSQYAANHVLLGLPSAAGKQPDDFLLTRERYVLSYNRSRKVMNWASWHLGREDFGGAKRQKDFREDPDIPEEWGRAMDDDYSQSGWTRGHMVPSGETTSTVERNSSTYLMTNIVPQAQSVNNGPWNKLENYYRDLVRFEGKHVYLIAGTIFKGPTRTLPSGVHIPSATFKIAVVLDRGQTIADINADTRVISVIMPNDRSISEQAKWASFRTTPLAIQKATGLDFFSHLSPQIADALRGKMDREKIPDVDHPLWLQMQQQSAAAN
jgi:endonuclease G